MQKNAPCLHYCRVQHSFIIMPVRACTSSLQLCVWHQGSMQCLDGTESPSPFLCVKETKRRNVSPPERCLVVGLGAGRRLGCVMIGLGRLLLCRPNLGAKAPCLHSRWAVLPSTVLDGGRALLLDAILAGGAALLSAVLVDARLVPLPNIVLLSDRWTVPMARGGLALARLPSTVWLCEAWGGLPLPRFSTVWLCETWGGLPLFKEAGAGSSTGSEGCGNGGGAGIGCGAALGSALGAGLGPCCGVVLCSRGWGWSMPVTVSGVGVVSCVEAVCSCTRHLGKLLCSSSSGCL